MSLIADYGFVLLILACAFGFFMAWGVGANDVANAVVFLGSDMSSYISGQTLNVCGAMQTIG